MILYLTKQTFERFNLTPPELMRSPVKEITEEVKKREQGNRLLETEESAYNLPTSPQSLRFFLST